MKWLLLTLLLIPTLAQSEETVPKGDPLILVMRCFDGVAHPDVALKDGFGELPFVEGNGSFESQVGAAPIGFTLYVNPETMSWTIISTIDGYDGHCEVMGGDKKSFRPAMRKEGVKL